MGKKDYEDEYLIDDREDMSELINLISSMTDAEFEEYMMKEFGKPVPWEEIYGE